MSSTLAEQTAGIACRRWTAHAHAPPVRARYAALPAVSLLVEQRAETRHVMKPACRWIDYDHMSCLAVELHLHRDREAAKRVVRSDHLRRGREYGGQACSRAQGKRFVERWVFAWSGCPKYRKRPPRDPSGGEPSVSTPRRELLPTNVRCYLACESNCAPVSVQLRPTRGLDTCPRLQCKSMRGTLYRLYGRS